MRLFDNLLSYFDNDGSCMIHVKCYLDPTIEAREYGLDVGLREKGTGRKVLIICPTPSDRERLDCFLARAESHIDKNPGLFQRTGEDHLLIYGADSGQKDDRIFISVIRTLGARYKLVCQKKNLKSAPKETPTGR